MTESWEPERIAASGSPPEGMLGTDFADLDITRLPIRGQTRSELISIEQRGPEAFAFVGSSRGTAFAWTSDTGSEYDPKPHIFIWVYRP
jgi:hypothetical protein